MINSATSRFEIVELPTVRVTVPKAGKGKKATCTNYTKVAEIFDKTSAQISNLVYKCWLSRYPHCWYLIHDNWSEFKLHFHALCATYGVKCKPTSIKNPTANDTGAYSCSVNKHATHSRTQYGQVGECQRHQYLFIRHHMGHLLYPHSIKSLTRCSNIWTRHLIWHSIDSWVEIK